MAELRPNAIDLLKADHREVKSLLDNLEATTVRGIKTRRDVLAKISLLLKAHVAIEEEIFYPAFKQAGDGKDDSKMFFEAMEEHRAAGDMVLPDLLNTSPDTENFSGRAKVLKELVTHHADEEEKEMFKRARKLMEREELLQLGERMAARKKEVLAGNR